MIVRDLRKGPESLSWRAEELLHELAWFAVWKSPSPLEAAYRRHWGKPRYKGKPGEFIQGLSAEKRELLKNLRSEDLAKPTLLASLIGK